MEVLVFGRVLNGSTKVEFFYFHAGRFGIIGGDGVVEDYLGGSDVGSAGELVARLILSFGVGLSRQNERTLGVCWMLFLCFPSSMGTSIS